MPGRSVVSPPFLGRWCLPLGKWAQTCRPAIKARFADADNSVWERPPLNADGEEARPPGDARAPSGAPAAAKAREHPGEEDGRSTFARLVASYHG